MDRFDELEAAVQLVGLKLKEDATGLVDSPSLHWIKHELSFREPSWERILHFHLQGSAVNLPVESLDARRASL